MKDNPICCQETRKQTAKEIFKDFRTIQKGIYNKSSTINNMEKIPLRWFIRDIETLEQKYLKELNENEYTNI